MMSGFYLYPPSTSPPALTPVPLGPYHGRPACVSFVPKGGKGVCADAFTSAKPVVVSNVDEYPGHIGELSGDSQSLAERV